MKREAGTSVTSRPGVEAPRVPFSTAATVITFGLLSATTTGMAALPSTQEVVGHGQLTGGLSSTATLSLSVGRQTSQSSAAQLVELRDSSGLTWDQIARLFGVSRRAVHHWASGDNMNSHNHELLSRLSAVVNGLPGATGSEKKQELLRPRENGDSIFDVLRQEAAAGGANVNGPTVSVSALLGITPL